MKCVFMVSLKMGPPILMKVNGLPSLSSSKCNFGGTSFIESGWGIQIFNVVPTCSCIL